MKLQGSTLAAWAAFGVQISAAIECTNTEPTGNDCGAAVAQLNNFCTSSGDNTIFVSKGDTAAFTVGTCVASLTAPRASDFQTDCGTLHDFLNQIEMICVANGAGGIEVVPTAGGAALYQVNSVGNIRPPEKRKVKGVEKRGAPVNPTGQRIIINGFTAVMFGVQASQGGAFTSGDVGTVVGSLAGPWASGLTSSTVALGSGVEAGAAWTFFNGFADASLPLAVIQEATKRALSWAAGQGHSGANFQLTDVAGGLIVLMDAGAD